ncbi:MAG: hypothetical protein M1826_002274 [Phylliscum demangeonii]|nr:MAG: hypothetical protein M1826_002274 [Phylliscum demangeonii]
MATAAPKIDHSADYPHGMNAKMASPNGHITSDRAGAGLDVHRMNGYPPTRGSLNAPLLPNGQIIDVRQGGIQHALRADLLKSLRPGPGQEKRMPTLLLYDEAGLKLFEEITYLEEYYLTNAEIDVLTRDADAIAQRIQPNSILLELGSGNLRKVKLLLDAIERTGRDVDYYALDLSVSELERTLSQLPKNTYQHVKCYGLHGTYDDGLAWVNSPKRASTSKCIMSLGSSVGNFNRADAADFLGRVVQGFGPKDSVLIGLDACKDPEKVFHAYNDEGGVTHAFLRNGLAQANTLLGKAVFRQEDWTVIGEYDAAAGRHQAFYSPTREFSFDGIIFRPGERIRIEESYKYSADESSQLWEAAGLRERERWANVTGDYYLHLLSKPAFSFPLKPEVYARSYAPTLDEWNQLWAAWDTITREMIAPEDLFLKPIDLRHPYVFYLGHIPTFLGIHVARATGRAFAGSPIFQRIFERGIDPDVNRPELCHDHSEVPDTWPPLDEIFAHQEQVRHHVRALYGQRDVAAERKLGRALWLAFEHEAMHLETLLYMLVQSEKILPPPGAARPNFEALARDAAAARTAEGWLTIPAATITIGHDDPDTDDGPERHFGWDNEKPSRQITVGTFRAQAGPVTNAEYARYLADTDSDRVPASWVRNASSNGVAPGAGLSNGTQHTNGVDTVAPAAPYLNGTSVRSVYGLIPLEQAQDWPVLASYDELSGYARWMDGRIPTYEEVCSIYEYVEQSNAKRATNYLTDKIAAVNGHLSNDGVEETPPAGACEPAFSRIESRATAHDDAHAHAHAHARPLFIDLEGCNVGFRHWHPTAATPRKAGAPCGQAELGGVWEWTSSVLEKHAGFEPMKSYPAYTADFFDGKHNIVLGGSWATHPRIAGRKSFVNWYQRNYPYAWAGARLVRDDV